MFAALVDKAIFGAGYDEVLKTGLRAARTPDDTCSIGTLAATLADVKAGREKELKMTDDSTTDTAMTDSILTISGAAYNARVCGTTPQDMISHQPTGEIITHLLSYHTSAYFRTQEH